MHYLPSCPYVVFMLKCSLYQHICLTALLVIGVSQLLQIFKISVYHLTPNNHAEVSRLLEICGSFFEGKPKYHWSVSRAFNVWLQAEHWAKIERATMQSVRLCDYMWQTVVCGLSAFHCRRCWLLVYSLYSYCNNTQNHLPYCKFIARHCAVYTHVHTCIQMLLLLNCPFSYWHIILRVWKPPTDTLPIVFS